MGNEEKRRTGSIAGKLHWMFVRRILFGFLILDLAIAAAAIIGFLGYSLERKGGHLSELKFNKEFAVEAEADGLHVTVPTKQGTRSVIAERPLMDAAHNIAVVIAAVELLILLRVVLFDRFPIRRKLKPLREMATNARNISNMNWNEEKLQNLTYAISHVDAESPSDHVRTNDAELDGIERALNDLLDRMRDAAREQTRFVSDASHELRTPIAVIKGYADMLDRWGKEDKVVLEEAIAAIRTESDHMNTLVEQLLFLARGDSGRTKLCHEQTSLTALMSEVFEESEMIDPKHKYEFEKQGGEVICYGDAAMLKQSMRILVDNAAKYSQEGDTITLRVGVSKEYRPFFSVQDNGVGMNASDVEHIFERFYRSDTARNSKTGGTGLGLAIAKWIINRHHGTIQVQSRPEIGTRFTVYLHAQQESFENAVVITE